MLPIKNNSEFLTPPPSVHSADDDLEQFSDLHDLAATVDLLSHETELPTDEQILTRKKVENILKKFRGRDDMMKYVEKQERQLIDLVILDYKGWDRQGIARYELRPGKLEGLFSCTVFVLKGAVVNKIDNETLADIDFPDNQMDLS